jgi:hypothetical protein
MFVSNPTPVMTTPVVITISVVAVVVVIAALFLGLYFGLSSGGCGSLVDSGIPNSFPLSNPNFIQKYQILHHLKNLILHRIPSMSKREPHIRLHRDELRLHIVCIQKCQQI